MMADEHSHIPEPERRELEPAGVQGPDIAAPPVAPTVPKLPPDSWFGRIGYLVQAARGYLPIAIREAEELLGAGTGAQKRAYVVHAAVGWLRVLEGHYDVIPDPLERSAFALLEWALGPLVDELVGRIFP